jgi:hypothetical protein
VSTSNYRHQIPVLLRLDSVAIVINPYGLMYRPFLNPRLSRKRLAGGTGRLRPEIIPLETCDNKPDYSVFTIFSRAYVILFILHLSVNRAM